MIDEKVIKKLHFKVAGLEYLKNFLVIGFVVFVFFSDTFPRGECLVDFGKSRDRKKYPNQTKPNIYRNGFKNFRIVDS